MRVLTVDAGLSGQRLDKYLKRYLRAAGDGFIYKMLRKKNITLNKKKASGSEILSEGDEISLFLSDETIDKFSCGTGLADYKVPEADKAYVRVIFENEDIIIVDKPVGLICQKSSPNDYSLNDWLIDYLREKGCIDRDSLSVFKPSSAHRLDRNTGGLVICSKTYKGSRVISELIKKREIKKYYICAVTGSLEDKAVTGRGFTYCEAYHLKDKEKNKVQITDKMIAGSSKIITGIRSVADRDTEEYFKNLLKLRASENGRIVTESLFAKGEISLLEISLETGRSHQIRAHLSHLGHPLLGDIKYLGNGPKRALTDSLGLKSQFLYANRIKFPAMEGELSELSNMEISLCLLGTAGGFGDPPLRI